MMSAQLQEQQRQQQEQEATQPNALATPVATGSSSLDASLTAHAAGVGLSQVSSSYLTNRASESDSPYVRLHASTPVAWQLLDDATLERAKAESKPIFMHIGFLADHQCRLTTQDSFSNPQVAALLNDAFIPIIIDREERPDLDTIYQNYSEAVNATGGWPLNLILTPDLYPIFGGTYWPGPGTDHSLSMAGGGERDSSSGAAIDIEELCIDFLAISKKVLGYWQEQQERCRKEALETQSKLLDFAQEGVLWQDPTKEPQGAQEQAAAPARDITKQLADLTGEGGQVRCTQSQLLGSNLPLQGSPQPRTAVLSSAAEIAGTADLDLDQVEEAVDRIAKMYDQVNGGFGTPKFPTPARLSFLLRLSQFPKEVTDVVGEEETAYGTTMALQTLRKIRDGGLRDHVGCGFMRFSVTSDWGMPHFEKMVGENALLLGVFLDAWLATSGSDDNTGKKKKDPERLKLSDEFADVVLELGDYLTDPAIRKDQGQSDGHAFITSEAADSLYKKGDENSLREGAYYLWTRREFDDVIAGKGGASQQHESAIAAAYWDVRPDGNIPREQDPYDEFINQNVLNATKADLGEISKHAGVPLVEAERIIAAAKEKLRSHREKERGRPARDEKVVVNINGMVISSLARTAAAIKKVDSERSTKYLEAAKEAAKFIKERLWLDDERQPGRKVLRRFYFERPSKTVGFADDYAFLIEGLLDLYETTLDKVWLDWAKELQDTQTSIFYDPRSSSSSGTPSPNSRQAFTGGFYSTELPTVSHTILRLKSGMDKTQPSTNGVSAMNLFRLGTLLNQQSYVTQAKETVIAFEAEILQYPWLFVSLLTGVVTARLGVKVVEFVNTGGDDDVQRAEYYTSPRAQASALCLVDSKVEDFKDSE
ncbi:Protein of unknown function, DUF255 domain containing protein [Naviculisporaceae sp. PSN 640]